MVAYDITEASSLFMKYLQTNFVECWDGFIMEVKPSFSYAAKLGMKTRRTWHANSHKKSFPAMVVLFYELALAGGFAMLE